MEPRHRVGTGTIPARQGSGSLDGAATGNAHQRPVPLATVPDPIDTGQAVATVGVSIPVPEPYGSELEGWRRHFGDPLGALVPAHITLLPPTQLPGAVVPMAEERLREVAAGYRAFDVMLRGTATFHPISPVVFLPVVRGIGDCERLQRAVRTGPLGRPLSFPYHPHVTVAQHLEEPVLDQAFDRLAHYTARFCADAFVLYLQNGDGTWRPYRRFALATDQ